MTSQSPPPDQPSEEELRAAYAQMRGTPVDQVVADIVQGLLTAAQVKLGRRDARLLLDLVAVVTEHAGPHLDASLRQQVEAALTQLRMAQVDGERQVAEAKGDEPNDLPGTPTPPGTNPPSTGSAGPTDEPPPTSRLWVPGR